MVNIKKILNNYVIYGLGSCVDAEEIKADILTILHEYGKVTLADMYELVGMVAPDHTYNRRGWSDKTYLEEKTIIDFNYDNEDRGWYIILPSVTYSAVSYTTPSYRYNRKKYLEDRHKSFSKQEPHSVHITIDTDAFESGNSSLGEIFDFIYAIKDRDVFVSVI